MAPARHLSLVPETEAERIEWPVPFADGLDMLVDLRGRRVAVLASGDPFWFGAGSTIARRLDSGEWRALPGVSCFALAASELGWSLEHVSCVALHASPLTRLRPFLAPGARIVTTLRDGDAVLALGRYLIDTGFGASAVTVFEALGGPRARQSTWTAETLEGFFSRPVCAAIDVTGGGAVLGHATGRADSFFESDSVMTKRPVRALALSALAPGRGELLWDIGGGSGTIAIEWLLSHPSTAAISVERRADRARMIRRNAEKLGVDRLRLVEGSAPDCLADLPVPDAVFVGGGLSEALLSVLHAMLPSGTRLVANAVTIETQSLLSDWHGRIGGSLLRMDLAEAKALGQGRAWQASYPLTQWSVTL